MYWTQPFRKYLYILGIINDSQECRLFYQSEETVKHILLDCERLEVRIRAVFQWRSAYGANGATAPGQQAQGSDHSLDGKRYSHEM